MVSLVEGEVVDIVGLDRVAHKAAGRMGVQSNHEKEGQVVGVPEHFKGLIANLFVGGAVHEDHDEKHKMPSDTASLLVVDIKGNLLADLCKKKKLQT